MKLASCQALGNTWAWAFQWCIKLLTMLPMFERRSSAGLQWFVAWLCWCFFAQWMRLLLSIMGCPTFLKLKYLLEWKYCPRFWPLSVDCRLGKGRMAMKLAPCRALFNIMFTIFLWKYSLILSSNLFLCKIKHLILWLSSFTFFCVFWY